MWKVKTADVDEASETLLMVGDLPTFSDGIYFRGGEWNASFKPHERK